MSFSPSSSQLKQQILDVIPADIKLYNSADTTQTGSELSPQMDLFLTALCDAIVSKWESFTGGLLIPALMVAGGAQAVGNGAPYSGGTPPLAPCLPGSIIPTIPLQGVESAYENPYDDDKTPEVTAMLRAIDSSLMTYAMMFVSTLAIPGAQADPTSIAGWINAPPVISPGPFSGLLATVPFSDGTSVAIPSATVMKDLVYAMAIGLSFSPLDPTAVAYQQILTAIIEGFSNSWFEDWLPYTEASAGAGVGICAPGGIATGAITAVLVSNA